MKKRLLILSLLFISVVIMIGCTKQISISEKLEDVISEIDETEKEDFVTLK